MDVCFTVKYCWAWTWLGFRCSGFEVVWWFSLGLLLSCIFLNAFYGLVRKICACGFCIWNCVFGFMDFCGLYLLSVVVRYSFQMNCQWPYSHKKNVSGYELFVYMLRIIILSKLVDIAIVIRLKYGWWRIWVYCCRAVGRLRWCSCFFRYLRWPSSLLG